MSVELTKQIAKIAAAAAEARVGSIHVGASAEVIEYDPDDWTCVVRQEVRQRNVDENGEDTYNDVVITDVPVKWPVFQGFSIVGHLAEGDQVFLVYADRSHEEWKRGEGPGIEASSNRRWDYTDAFALPGGLAPGETPGSPDSGSVEIGHHDSGTVFRINDNGTFAIENGTNELISLIVSLVTTLISATVTTATGTYPLGTNTVSSLTLLKTKFETLEE